MKKYLLCGLAIFFMLGILSAKAQLGRAENEIMLRQRSFVVLSAKENSSCTLPKQCPAGLICKNHSCQRCEVDADCDRFDTLCKEHNGTNWCMHKGPIPISWHDGLGYTILSIASAVAGAAGMGGGPLFVPVLIFIFNFDTEYAIPLSKILILGVAVANFILNVAQTDPQAPHEWLIKYDVALLFLPLTLFGTTIGVLLNLIFPAYLIVLLLFLIMLFSIWKTVLNARNLMRKDRIKEAEALAKASHINERASLLDTTRGVTAASTDDDDDLRYRTNAVVIGNDAATQDAAKSSAENATTRCSLSDFFCSNTTLYNVLTILIWLFVFGVSVVKGGSSSPVSIIRACSWQYWLIFVGLGPVLFLFTIAVGAFYRRKYDIAESSGTLSSGQDICWNKRNTLLYPWVACAAGLAAGLMGVGSGVMIGPLLLELGMRPEPASATTAFMILFTASSVTLQFLMLGRLPAGYALPLIFCGFITGFVGKYLINRLVRKYGKPVYLVFALIVFLIAGTLALAGLTIFQIVLGDAQNGFSMKAVCVDHSSD